MPRLRKGASTGLPFQLETFERDLLRFDRWRKGTTQPPPSNVRVTSIEDSRGSAHLRRRARHVPARASPCFERRMPLYELLCMARPLAARKELAEVANRAGRTVLESGGIVADVKSYGEHTLAYTIRTASGERIRQVSLSFHGSTCDAKSFTAPPEEKASEELG